MIHKLLKQSHFSQHNENLIPHAVWPECVVCRLWSSQKCGWSLAHSSCIIVSTVGRGNRSTKDWIRPDALGSYVLSCTCPSVEENHTISLHFKQNTKLKIVFQTGKLFFFSDRQPCRSDLQSGWCYKTSRPVGLLPSPTAWSSDQHPVAVLADVSRHTLGRTEGRGLGFGQLVRTHTGKCLKCQSSSDGHSEHNALCAGGR